MHGHGEGDYIRLRDECGNVLVSCATLDDDDLVRYRFRDHNRPFEISGVSDSYGVVLRDEKGETWRGFVD